MRVNALLSLQLERLSYEHARLATNIEATTY